jgi:dihydroxyacid dehydratase/phosphogluconate dehydratase
MATKAQKFEVSFELEVEGDATPEEIEDHLARLVTVLTEKAAELALGPAGAIHGSTLELLFMVEAADAAEMHAKLHDIAVILGTTPDVDVARTSARRGDRDLVLA